MKTIKSYPKWFFIWFALILATASTIYAQEQIFFLGEELGVGTRAMSMGGAYVGVAEDYSAIYWNPAGLGQIRRMELNLGFSHNRMVNNATFMGEKLRGQNSFSRLNSIGFVFPVPTYRGSLVFGIGYNKVRDFDNVLEIDGFNPSSAAFPDIVIPTYDNYTTTIDDSLYQTESILEEGSLNHFSLAGAVEVQENFFLGATLNFVSGKDDYALRFQESDDLHLYDTPFVEGDNVISDLDYWIYDQSIGSKYSAANLKIGALYKFASGLRLGATIITPTKYEIKESWSEGQKEYYDNVEDAATLSNSGEFKYDIQEPYAFGFGASFRLVNLLLSGGVEFKDWSQAKFRSDPPVAGVTKADMNVRIKQDLQAVTKVRLGAEMYVPIVHARLRAGYFTDPSPYRYSNIRPDKEYLTAGASLMLDKQVMVDVGLMHGSWKIETTDDLTKAPTLEDHTFDKIIGTLSIRF